MTKERGWYPNDDDDHVIRFWTGSEWEGERVWDGGAWVEREAQLAPAAPPAAPVHVPANPPQELATHPQPSESPAVQTSTTVDVQAIATGATRAAADHVSPFVNAIKAGKRPLTAFYFLAGGVLAAAFGAFFPWIMIDQSEQTDGLFGLSLGAFVPTHPSSAGKFMLVVPALLVLFFGLSTYAGKPSGGSRVGMIVTTVVMAGLALLTYSAVSSNATTGMEVGVGFGFVLYTLGITLIGVAILLSFGSKGAKAVTL